MKFLITLIASLLLISSALADDVGLTKNCASPTNCEYSLGSTFKFYLFGIGTEIPEVQFINSNRDDGYFGVVELGNNCVRVVAGTNQINSGAAVAFVSAQNGIVYPPRQGKNACPIN